MSASQLYLKLLGRLQWARNGEDYVALGKNKKANIVAYLGYFGPQEKESVIAACWPLDGGYYIASLNDAIYRINRDFLNLPGRKEGMEEKCIANEAFDGIVKFLVEVHTDVNEFRECVRRIHRLQREEKLDEEALSRQL